MREVLQDVVLVTRVIATLSIVVAGVSRVRQRQVAGGVGPERLVPSDAGLGNAVEVDVAVIVYVETDIDARLDRS